MKYDKKDEKLKAKGEREYKEGIKKQESEIDENSTKKVLLACNSR